MLGHMELSVQGAVSGPQGVEPILRKLKPPKHLLVMWSSACLCHNQFTQFEIPFSLKELQLIAVHLC